LERCSGVVTYFYAFAICGIIGEWWEPVIRGGIYCRSVDKMLGNWAIGKDKRSAWGPNYAAERSGKLYLKFKNTRHFIDYITYLCKQTVFKLRKFILKSK